MRKEEKMEIKKTLAIMIAALMIIPLFTGAMSGTGVGVGGAEEIDAGLPTPTTSFPKSQTQLPFMPNNNSLSSKIDDILDDKPVFVFFYTDCCLFCHQQMPVIDELEKEYAGKLAFIRINVDERPDYAEEFWVDSLPIMFVISDKVDGQYVKQEISGFTEKMKIGEIIDLEIGQSEQNPPVNITPENTSNNPPILISPTPDQNWDMNTNTTITLALAQHFADPDGDDLNYTSTQPRNIPVFIDNDTSTVILMDDEGDVNVTASSITCDSCKDCSDKLNGKYDTVILTKDIIDVKGSCITFGANNVVFDGNGHKIDGDDVGEFDSGIIMNGKSGNTIKNCDITDFESGITLYGSSKNEIYGNKVSSNYYDGIWISTNSDLNNIHDNLIENNGKYGIYFSSDSNNNIFSENVVCSNTKDIYAADKNSGDDNTCGTSFNWNPNR
jgi:parallel beta-helix repeat protein